MLQSLDFLFWRSVYSLYYSLISYLERSYFSEDNDELNINETDFDENDEDVRFLTDFY